MALRPKDVQPVEEDAATLQLGPDFQGAVCMWNSQMVFALENELQRREKDREMKDPEAAESVSNKVLLDTLRYVKLFHNFRSDTDVKAAKDRIRQEYDLFEPFEIATIVNLNLAEPDEVFALVPSLNLITPHRAQKGGRRITREMVENLLADLARFQESPE